MSERVTIRSFDDITKFMRKINDDLNTRNAEAMREDGVDEQTISAIAEETNRVCDETLAEWARMFGDQRGPNDPLQ